MRRVPAPSPAALRRPVLAPPVRRLWRDAETLQLGRAGNGGLLVGLDPRTRHALSLLDGTRDETQLVLQAVDAGCPAPRARQLLDLLDSCGLLGDAGQEHKALAGLDRDERERLLADLDSLALLRGDGGAPALRLRRGARVMVLGAGRVGAPLAGLLAAAGIGAVDVVDEGLTRPQDVGVGGLDHDDIGRPRGDAARARLQMAVPSTDTCAQSRPDLVVLAPARPDRLDEARDRVPPGTAHLLVEVRETVGVVGPLVLPGRGPCLHCLDLTRTDLDPGWPTVAAQLAGPSRSRQACDGPLALMVASQAAAQVLTLVDGTGPAVTLGGTLELALPDWRWRRRSWGRHPCCACIADRAG